MPQLRPPLTPEQVARLKASDGVRLIKEAYDRKDCMLLVDWLVEFNAQANVYLEMMRSPMVVAMPPQVLTESANRAGVDGTLAQLALAFMGQLDCPFSEEEILESTKKRAAEIFTER